MRTHTMLRRLAVAGLGAALAIGLLAGCAKKTTPGAASSSGDSAVGGIGAADPTASAGDGGGGGAGQNASSGTTGNGGGNTGNTGNGGNGGSTEVTYPSDAKTYCTQAVQAWLKKQDTRIKQLSNAGGAVNWANIQTNLNTDWKYIKGDGAAGSTYCVVRNDNGDELQIQVNNQLLGKPMAITNVVLDRTEYASSADDYVHAIITAWENGNTQRMAAYSNSTVVSYLTKHSAPPDWTDDPQTTNGDHVAIRGSSRETGDSYTFQVKTSPGGKAHAILSVGQ
jgi:hypothetical protein